MIEGIVTQDMIEEADQLTEDIGYLRDSILEGKGTFIGMVGQLSVKEYLQCEHAPTYDYDLIHKGFKLEVKTKACTSEPRPEYDASVADSNTKQKCDRYVFARVERDRYVRNYLTGRVWIIGWMDKEEYFEKTTFYKKVQIDPNGNGWKFDADCHNLVHSELNDIRELL